MREPLLAALGIGKAATLAVLLVSPLAGVLTGLSGVVLLMLRLAENARETCDAARDLVGP